MQVPPASRLLEMVRDVPAAAVLWQRAGDLAGVHIVGGAVRDLLLGGRPLDLDLVVEGDAGALTAALGGRRLVHDRFGTSTVALDRFSYDIARARRERYAFPGALPEVAPATLAEDLSRRDFTVNAAAITLGGADAGRLTSVPHFLEDLEQRRLRVLHSRSFSDDPTRLLRLVRYASRLGFALQPGTRRLALEAIAGGALGTVSGARVGAELRLLAREPDPVAALAGLSELGLDRAIHPRLRLADVDLARRALALLPAGGRRDTLVLAVAGSAVPAVQLAALLESLAFTAEDRDVILAAQHAPDLARGLAQARTPSQIAAAAQRAPVEVVALAGALGPAEQARAWLARLRHVRLEIDGRDLLAAGVPAGPAIGRGLRAALAAKLDGQLDGRQAELEYAVQAAQGSG